MSEGEFKKRFGALFYDNLTGKVHSGKDFFEVLDEAQQEILDNFSCLPKLQNVLLKWFGSGEKE